MNDNLNRNELSGEGQGMNPTSKQSRLHATMEREARRLLGRALLPMQAGFRLGRNDGQWIVREFDRASGGSLAAVQSSLRRDPPLQHIVQNVGISFVSLFHFQRSCQVGKFLQNGILSNLTAGFFKDLAVLQI